LVAGTNTHRYSLFTTCTFIFKKSVQISRIRVIRVLIAAGTGAASVWCTNWGDYPCFKQKSTQI